MKIWNDEEVLSLFKEVEQCKQAGKSLKNAFISHANAFKRKPNSVRNYYYHEVDNLTSDKQRCQRLGIDLSQHSKSHFENFDKVAEGELFDKIERCVSQGMSVRSACQQLSGGNLSLMTRLQNKYQNMKRKIEPKDNIIPFKKQKLLTDADINSLFMGLVRLIKKSAMEDAANSNTLLEKSFRDLKEKEEENEKLREQVQHLQAENKILLCQNEKRSALENHIKSSKQDFGKRKRV